jgi:hypothetical protein
MHRNALRAGPLAFAFALLSALPSVVAATPLISEVFYDATGSDDGHTVEAALTDREAARWPCGSPA